jgi:hypothetical protein
MNHGDKPSCIDGQRVISALAILSTSVSKNLWVMIKAKAGKFTRRVDNGRDQSLGEKDRHCIEASQLILVLDDIHSLVGKMICQRIG